MVQNEQSATHGRLRNNHATHITRIWRRQCRGKLNRLKFFVFSVLHIPAAPLVCLFACLYVCLCVYLLFTFFFEFFDKKMRFWSPLAAQGGPQIGPLADNFAPKIDFWVTRRMRGSDPGASRSQPGAPKPPKNGPELKQSTFGRPKLHSWWIFVDFWWPFWHQFSMFLQGEQTYRKNAPRETKSIKKRTTNTQASKQALKQTNN